jgi:hypothetical protein
MTAYTHQGQDRGLALPRDRKHRESRDHRQSGQRRRPARQEAESVVCSADGVRRHVLKEALVQLPLGRSALRISVFIPMIPDEFVLGL